MCAVLTRLPARRPLLSTGTALCQEEVTNEDFSAYLILYQVDGLSSTPPFSFGSYLTPREEEGDWFLHPGEESTGGCVGVCGSKQI